MKDIAPNTDESKIAKICDYVLEHIDLTHLEIPEEYYYSCLPLCLLDAVYSIGVHYTSAKNVVDRYCSKMQITKIREPKDEIPTSEEHTMDDLIAAIGDDVVAFSDHIVCNHHLTADGRLKGEVVLEMAKVLRDAGIQTIRDFNHVMFGESETAGAIETRLNAAAKKNSCLSVDYLMMLCGDENACKPDRHILDFLALALGYPVEKTEAKTLLSEVADRLKQKNPALTLRALDYAIWSMMS